MFSDSQIQTPLFHLGEGVRKLLSRQSKAHGWYAALLIVFALLVATGVKEFTVWQQILDAFSTQEVEAASHSKGELDKFVHQPRVALMWPVMWLSALTGWDRDLIFAAVVLINLLLASIMLGGALAKRTRGSQSWSGLLFFAFFACLSLVMNGRMSFSFLATCAFLWLYERREKHSLRAYAVASLPILWAASVSTGVYAIVFAWVILVFAQYATGRVSGQRPGVSDFAIALPALALYAGFAIAGTMKNLAFYGDDWLAPFRMLHHGAGRYLFTPWAPLVVAVVFAVYRFRRLYLPVGLPIFYYAAAASGLAGGAFGFSTMTTAIPPLLILGLLKLMQIPEKRNR